MFSGLTSVRRKVCFVLANALCMSLVGMQLLTDVKLAGKLQVRRATCIAYCIDFYF